MEQARAQTFRRFGVLSIVLGGHVLLVVLMSSGRLWDPRKRFTQTEPEAVFTLLDLESRTEQPSLEQTPKTPPPDRATAAPSSERGESTAINPDESGVKRKIDWYRERELALQTTTPQLIEEYVQRCARAERARAPRPPGCPRRSFDGPWRPSGNIVQDMRDPDRPPSSVPEPLPEAFPKRPRPEVFEEED